MAYRFCLTIFVLVLICWVTESRKRRIRSVRYIGEISADEWVYQDENGRFKRATGDPCKTLFTRVPTIFTPVLTTTQWMSLLNTGYGAFSTCGGPAILKATNVAAAAGSLSNAGVGNLTSINTTGLNAGNAASVIGSVNVAGVNTTALTNLMSCMQTPMMGWVTPQIMQFMPLLTVYTTLNTQLSTTANPNGTANCIGQIIIIMKNNLLPFGYQMLDAFESTQSKGRSLNATIRQSCILGCRFFKIPMVNLIIQHIKAKFTPSVCTVVYTALNKQVLNLDVYNFTATPCTGSVDCTSCTSPCSPFDPTTYINMVIGKKKK